VPQRFEVAKENAAVNAIFLEIDPSTGKTLSLERIFKYVKD
jgi:calcineurin-like phosphoesterase